MAVCEVSARRAPLCQHTQTPTVLHVHADHRGSQSGHAWILLVPDAQNTIVFPAEGLLRCHRAVVVPCRKDYYSKQAVIKRNCSFLFIYFLLVWCSFKKQNLLFWKIQNSRHVSDWRISSTRLSTWWRISQTTEDVENIFFHFCERFQVKENTTIKRHKRSLYLRLHHSTSEQMKQSNII